MCVMESGALNRYSDADFTQLARGLSDYVHGLNALADCFSPSLEQLSRGKCKGA